MNQVLLEELENRVADLLEKYASLKEENARLNAENAGMREEAQRTAADREGIKSRVDAILGKLDTL